MLADRAWVQRNLGFDPVSKPPPSAASATAAAAKPGHTSEDLQREIIDFDSEGPAMIPTARYGAFISYRHAASAEVARGLQQWLQTYAKPWWRLPTR